VLHIRCEEWVAGAKEGYKAIHRSGRNKPQAAGTDHGCSKSFADREVLLVPDRVDNNVLDRVQRTIAVTAQEDAAVILVGKLVARQTARRFKVESVDCCKKHALHGRPDRKKRFANWNKTFKPACGEFPRLLKFKIASFCLNQMDYVIVGPREELGRPRPEITFHPGTSSCGSGCSATIVAHLRAVSTAATVVPEQKLNWRIPGRLMMRRAATKGSNSAASKYRRIGRGEEHRWIGRGGVWRG